MAALPDIRVVDDRYSVSGQISPDQVEALAAAGYKSIICHRPDGEAPDQANFAAIAEQAERFGIAVRHIPVYPTGITPDAVVAMRDALEEMPGPVFAYCRSGARSTNAYMLASAG